MLRKKSIISDVLKELSHAEQFRRGEIEESTISRIKTEILAHEYYYL